MRLSLIENGLDSLHKGYKSLIEYEDLSIKNEDDYQKSILLKDAILNTHHGIEILMKYILSAHNELLVFSNIDNDVQNAYKEKHQKCLNSIFESSNIDKVHTVSFSEAFERLKSMLNSNQIVTDVCGIKAKYILEATKLAEPATYLAHHPMSGCEKNGIEYSESFSFKGKNFIIITS